MKISDLKDGYRIEIKRPVTNPNIDKRERYDTNKLPWTVGDRFRVKQYGDVSVALDPIYIQGTQRKAISNIFQHHEAFEALIEACELLPESATDLIHAAGGSQYDYPRILILLLERGFVTVENLRAVATEVASEEG